MAARSQQRVYVRYEGFVPDVHAFAAGLRMLDVGRRFRLV